MYGIDCQEFAHTVQKGVACSTSVSPLPGKNHGLQVMVQGNQTVYIGNLLTGKCGNRTPNIYVFCTFTRFASNSRTLKIKKALQFVLSDLTFTLIIRFYMLFLMCSSHFQCWYINHVVICCPEGLSTLFINIFIDFKKYSYSVLQKNIYSKRNGSSVQRKLAKARKADQLQWDKSRWILRTMNLTRPLEPSY